MVELNDQVNFVICYVDCIAVVGKSCELTKEESLDSMVGKNAINIGESAAVQALFLTRCWLSLHIN
jgi:hypothetical protein